MHSDTMTAVPKLDHGYPPFNNHGWPVVVVDTEAS